MKEILQSLLGEINYEDGTKPKNHTGKQTVEFYFQFLYPTTAEINPPAMCCIDIVSFGSRSRPSEHKILTKELQNRFPRNVDVDKSATRPCYSSYLELHFVHGDELASSITYHT